jgi:hypothetical protein
MCIFHKWSRWEQYQLKWVDSKNHTSVKIIERRQRRHCEKCNKEQDELI